MAREYRHFTVTVTAMHEDIRRDWQGYVDGYGPGDKYKGPIDQDHRIVCEREGQAREWALELYRYSGCKDVEVTRIVSIPVDQILMACP